MATITPMQNLTYGLLSNAAYKNGTVPPGWSIVDTSGTRTHVVPEGIVVETTGGHISLLVTRIDDRTVIDANRDGMEAANEHLYFCERIAA
jgi:hypothetical protein